MAHQLGVSDSSPRSSISDETITAAIVQCCPQFGIESLKPLQCFALSQLVRGDDVLACFPTGYGKSMIFHMLPRVCQVLRLNALWSEWVFYDFPYQPNRCGSGAIAVSYERSGC